MHDLMRAKILDDRFEQKQIAASKARDISQPTESDEPRHAARGHLQQPGDVSRGQDGRRARPGPFVAACVYSRASQSRDRPGDVLGARGRGRFVGFGCHAKPLTLDVVKGAADARAGFLGRTRDHANAYRGMARGNDPLALWWGLLVRALSVGAYA